MPRSALVLGVVFAMSAAGVARAGPYADELSKCISGKLTDADRTALAVWLFEELSAHPALKPLANVTEAQRADASKTVATLVQRLLIDECRPQAAAAFRNEGGGVALRSFWEIGQQSVASLARDPAVAGNMQQIGQYIDTAKLAAAMRDPDGKN